MKSTLKFYIYAAVMRYMQRRYTYLSYKYREDMTDEHKAELENIKSDKKHLEEVVDEIIESSIDLMPKNDLEILDDPVLSDRFLDLTKYRQWKKDNNNKK